MRRAPAALLAIVAPLAIAAGVSIEAFSSMPPGAALPVGWERVTLPNVAQPAVALVEDAGITVLRVKSVNAAGSVAHRLVADVARTPLLTWRWKVDRVLDKADLTRKDGDDYAARVYVSFDAPAESLSLATRARMKIAKLLYGADLPAAALCYVWDNIHAPGTTAWNPYSDRVRMIVLRSGGREAGRWMAESRDVAADYRAAFGADAQVPPISGIAASADTDQTGESVTAWFGDFRLEPRR
ncbi:MAG: DUF3047 domain-containing protein [Usitatibacter sp.]